MVLVRTFEHLSVASAEARSRHAEVTSEYHSEVTSTRHNDELLTRVVATGGPDEVSRRIATVVKLNTHRIYCDTHDSLQLDRLQTWLLPRRDHNDSVTNFNLYVMDFGVGEVPPNPAYANVYQ